MRRTKVGWVKIWLVVTVRALMERSVLVRRTVLVTVVVEKLVMRVIRRKVLTLVV